MLISVLTEHLPGGEGLFSIRACLGLGSLILLYRAAKGISELASSDTVSNAKFIIITAIAYAVASILQNAPLRLSARWRFCFSSLGSITGCIKTRKTRYF